MKKLKTSGITLIALVITIIVLLILAGVTIATLTGDNGILTRANDAKIETALGAVKEALKLKQGEKVINNEKLTPEILLSEGKVTRTVQTGENDTYYMYYAIKEDAYEGMQGLGKGNIASLKDVFLIDDKLNVKYIASNGKEYGDNLDNKVLEDETEIRFSSKAFSEYVSKISGVKEDEMKFKWMKNQTRLTISDPNIDSLQDLVFFPNLTYLGLENLNLKNLDGLDNCKNIKQFYAGNGCIKDIMKISYLRKLEEFRIVSVEINFNQIIDALKNNEILKTLVLDGIGLDSMKRIEELNPNLETLQLRYNNITKIEGLKEKKKLKSLLLNQNQITKIEGLENLQDLVHLDLSYNDILYITPLSSNSSLAFLNLRGNSKIDENRENYTEEELIALNKIEEILDRKGTIYLDINKIKLFNNYTKLDLSGQDLTNLEPLEGITSLKELNLNYNNLTFEDDKSKEILKSMTELETLNIEGNYIVDLSPINELEKLKVLTMHNANINGSCNLKQIEDIISNLKSFRAEQNTMNTLINCDRNKITKLYFTNIEINKLPDLSVFINIEELSIIENSKYANMDKSIVSELDNLKILKLSNMHNKMIDFSKLTNLNSLDLSNNSLWTEDLENLKALKNNTDLTINLSNNYIIDATALLELNSNTKVDLTKNVNLSQESKKALTEHFINNVKYDK